MSATSMQRSLFRTWAKWVGLGFSVAVASAWWGCSDRSWAGVFDRYVVILAEGGIRIGRTEDLLGSLLPTAWIEYSFSGRVRWSPASNAVFVFVPLWIPFLIFAISTAFLWHRDRRPPPNHCQSCGYNLTGNVSGVCPECGVSV